MLDLTQMQEIAKTKNVIFYKDNCPFCHASIKLLEELKKTAMIDDYLVLTLDEDYSNEALGELARSQNWESDSGQLYPSKPQIFLGGKWIGGNYELYNSNWNIGSGMPNLKNPLRF
jgi:glutaredoxin